MVKHKGNNILIIFDNDELLCKLIFLIIMTESRVSRICAGGINIFLQFTFLQQYILLVRVRQVRLLTL